MRDGAAPGGFELDGDVYRASGRIRFKWRNLGTHRTRSIEATGKGWRGLSAGAEDDFSKAQNVHLPAPRGKEVEPGPKIFDILKTSG